jgi:hypothetical protein
MDMGSSVSLIISNIYMEHFEKPDLDSAKHKPLLLLCYVDYTCGLSSLPRAVTLIVSIQFTMQIESSSMIPLLDQEDDTGASVYRKPTHSG